MEATVIDGGEGGSNSGEDGLQLQEGGEGEKATTTTQLQQNALTTVVEAPQEKEEKPGRAKEEKAVVARLSRTTQASTHMAAPAKQLHKVRTMTRSMQMSQSLGGVTRACLGGVQMQPRRDLMSSREKQEKRVKNKRSVTRPHELGTVCSAYDNTKKHPLSTTFNG
jgi:Trk-type K+ transport system membrane component